MSTGVKLAKVAVIVGIGIAVFSALIYTSDNVLDDSLLVYHYKQTLQYLFTDREDAQGLAIVVGMVDEHSKYSVKGAGMDIRNMEETFKELGFAVLKKQDVNRTELQAIVKAASGYPYITEAPSCKVIAFYFAGHGDSESQRALMVLKGGDKYFVEDVVSLFYPVNNKQMKHLKRLFFFDMCLGSERDQGVRKNNVTVPLLEYAVPAKGNSLVAFATTIGYYVRGNYNGGFWTQFLHKNLKKDQDIFSVLVDTWEETVNFTTTEYKVNPQVQGPSLTACMGHLNLRRLGDSSARHKLHEATVRTPDASTAGMTKAQPILDEAKSIMDSDSISFPGLKEMTFGATRNSENLKGKPEPVNLLMKEPRLSDIQECLNGMASKWREFGTCLQVESGKLESLSHDVSMSDTTRLMDVVNEWDNSRCSPHTFKKLNECLNKIGQNKYIEKIEQMLKDQRRYYSRKPDYIE